MKKQTLTKKQQKALLDIAKRLMVEVENRGDLEACGCDSEDFIEVPVFGTNGAVSNASGFAALEEIAPIATLVKPVNIVGTVNTSTGA